MVTLAPVVDYLRKLRKSWPHGPRRGRRLEVARLLATRPPLSLEDWHQRYGVPLGVSLEFVAWFRDTCSRCFEYDLAGAIPEDSLVGDLGLGEATWSDSGLDLLEEFEGEFNVKWPDGHAETFGELLQTLWLHSHPNHLTNR